MLSHYVFRHLPEGTRVVVVADVEPVPSLMPFASTTAPGLPAGLIMVIAGPRDASGRRLCRAVTDPSVERRLGPKDVALLPREPASP